MITPKAKLTFREKVLLPFIVLRIPFILLFNAFFARNSLRNKGKTKARLLFDSSARFVLAETTPAQLQAISVPTYKSYLNWAKNAGENPVIDELDTNARLMWIGGRQTGRVLIYCHGGGFIGPLSDFQCQFWRSVQLELAKDNRKSIDVGVLEYSLWPIGFPTQLQQLISAILHVRKSGVDPSNIYLAGDSAGANMILQLLAHTLHPITDLVEKSPILLNEGEGFGGVILFSPMVAMTGDTGSHKENDKFDLLPADRLKHWGLLYLAAVPQSQHPYIHINQAPEGWLKGIDKVVGKFFITAGEKECLRDDIISFSQTLEKVHPDITLDVQTGAVHADPLFDFAAKETELCPATKRLVEWLDM